MGRFGDFMSKLGVRSEPIPAKVEVTSTSSSTVIIDRDGTYVSTTTRNSLDALSSLLNMQKEIWSKSANKNIILTPRHIELRNYIFNHLNQGALGMDAKLREKSVEAILAYYRNAWNAMHPLQPQQAVTLPPVDTKSYIKSMSGSLYNNTLGLVWKSTPKSTTEPPKIENLTEEQVIEDLTELFTPVIHSIKHDYTDDIEGMLRNWEARSTQSPPGLPFRYGKSIRADEAIQIVERAYALKTHYIEVADNYNKKTFAVEGLEPFVKKTCGLLQAYYHELLKLNADLNPNNMLHWKQESAQKALDFYFDQREYLYKLVSLIRKGPKKTREDKITLMQDFKKYIKDRFARESLYGSHIIVDISWLNMGKWEIGAGVDKWTKIDAALEQYRVFCNLPGEEVPQPLPDKYDTVRSAGESGELATLKGRGLYFRYSASLKENDPFKPLNIYGAVKPIPPR